MIATIGLQDVRIHAPHGFFEEEHLMGNEFSIDVEVEASIGGAASEDDLGQTVNYATIYYLLQAEMKKPTQLLEALAYRMGERILNQFDHASAVKLRLRKLHPPLGGKVGAAFVEISLTAANSAGGRRQDTFEDPMPSGYGVSDTFDGSNFAGGNAAGFGGFAGNGGGGAGSGMTGFADKPRPVAAAPVVDDAGGIDDDAFDEEFGDEFDDYGEEELPDYDLPAPDGERTGKIIDPAALLNFDDIDDDAFDEEFDDDAFDEIDTDGINFDDLDFGDMNFNPEDFK